MSVKQIKKKYILNDAIDGLKLLLLEDQTLRQLDSNGNPIDVIARLEQLVETEKVRIDSILSAADADKDSFAEIVALINQIDMDNDTAFMNYATTNDARVQTVEDDLAQELLDRASADNTLQSNIDGVANDLTVYQTTNDSALAQEVSDRQSGDAALSTQIGNVQTSLTDDLNDYKALNDAAVAQEISDRQSEITRVEGLVSSEEAARILGDNNLSGEIATERTRIDNMLNLADMDKDTFKEIADLIASVDLENDNALVDAVSNLNSSISTEEGARIAADQVLTSAISTEESARIAADGVLQGNIDVVSDDLAQELLDRASADTTLQGNIDTVETNFNNFLTGDFSTEQGHIDLLQSKVASLESQVADLEGAAFEKENFVMSAQNIVDGFIDLQFEAKEKSIRFHVGRLGGFEGEDYSVSVVGGVTRITFIGSFASGGAEEMEEGDKVKVQYSR